jgi:shikimate kinase
MAERLGNDPNASQRPTLTGRSIIEEIKEVFASREALYQGVAHHILDGCSPVEAVVREAVEFLRGADRGTQGLF